MINFITQTNRNWNEGIMAKSASKLQSTIIHFTYETEIRKDVVNAIRSQSLLEFIKHGLKLLFPSCFANSKILNRNYCC